MKKTEKNLKGLKLAVAYGLAPNALGFCGPQCGEEMKLAGFFEGKISTGEIRKILTRFEAAYSYLELIAQKNKIIDPFDERVVEAFWIGNKLLDVVTAEDIKKMAIQKFSRPGLLSKDEIAKRLENISSGSRPHHSFHVYFFGTITGRVSLAPYKMKDVCRIGWGKIVSVEKTKAIIEYRPIIKKQKKYQFGKLIKKEVHWNKKIVPSLKKGCWVSFHWNMICQEISPKQRKNLEKYTKNTLKLLK